MALKQTIYLPDGPKPLWCSCCSSSMTSLFQKQDLFHLEHISPRSSYSFSSFRSMFKLPLLRDTPGEGNGNPLQYSYLENPMDRGAWWAPWGRKSWTRLRDQTTTFLSPLALQKQVTVNNINNNT